MSVILKKFLAPAWPLLAVLYVGRSLLQLPILWALVIVTVHVLGLTLLTCAALIVRPRVVEDIAALHQWYVKRVRAGGHGFDLGLLLRLLLLPLVLLAETCFILVGLAVATAFRLVFALQLYRCPKCRERIGWARETLRCEHCGHGYAGTLDQSCPRCLFAPNTSRCPHCGYLFTHGLGGNGPSPLVRPGEEEGAPV